MRITDSSVASQATHSYASQQQTQLSMRYQAPSAPHHHQHDAAQTRPEVSISSAGQEQAAHKTGDKDSKQQLSPYMSLVKQLLEYMLGHAIDLGQTVDGNGASSDAGSNGSSDTQAAPPPQQDGGSEGGFALDYSYSYQEQEAAQYSTSGVVKTADGREIQFNAELSMSRSYSETSSLNIATGSLAKQQKDPLILNFGGTAGQLSSQTFAFDIDNDGKQDQISQLKQGAAFLALDQNGNGKIDNGSELFGTQTGNGFAELARYDQDGNGWIDEGDAVFGQLKLWLKDDSGQDKLVNLKSMGVGAIYLGAAKADFSINDQQNNNLGKVRASGVYLTEAGAVGSLQQVDLSV
ncbi:hypothetical protein SAMN02745857_03208 [Andreprevotia lacus DSM 23236]|jgi:hypothetical protein|uniref:VCBS repeat-containing protein n=1 Tax=Andreprevotia lacus DSM 23236 TaxID=1121001 RepID=A0A1W1XWR4_9NEIS|nr:hypothetical protein [Andreprevotia lacus]SMC28312.1 hypothetical protein SAMN02745857_03208 [Andreprevotia lacus DSM 23236]